MDDATLVGPRGALRTGLDFIHHRLANSYEGLHLNCAKSLVWFPEGAWPQTDDDVFARFSWAPQGLTLLGSPVGTNEFISGQVHAKANSVAATARRVLDATEPQDGYLLVTHCLLPRLIYLARTVPPHLANNAWRHFDRRLQEEFRSALRSDRGRGPLHEGYMVTQQMTLQARIGGLGCTSMEEVVPLAFTSSFFQSVPNMRQMASITAASVLGVHVVSTT